MNIELSINLKLYNLFLFSMATKRNIRPTAKLFNERLELIDELVFKLGHIQSRQELFKKVNAKLKDKISIDAIDKDILQLKDELNAYNLKNNTNVELKFSRNTGYHYTQKGFRLYKNSVSDADKNLLLLANSLFNVFNGTPLQDKFSEVVKKVMAESLTGGTNLEAIPNDFVQVDKSVSLKSTQWIPRLLEAIFEKDCLEIVYKGKKRDMCPYVIKQYRNKWYMVAWDYSSTHKSKTNLYAIDNIEKIVGYSGEKYFVDPEFNAADYFKYSLGIWHEHNEKPVKVVLEFLEQKMFNGIINNPLHHSQKHTLNKAKNTLTIEIKVYDCLELHTMINSYGCNVKVLEPKTVAEKIAETARMTLNLYE